MLALSIGGPGKTDILYFPDILFFCQGTPRPCAQDPQLARDQQTDGRKCRQQNSHSWPTWGFVRLLDSLEITDSLSNPRHSPGPLQRRSWENRNVLGGVQALARLHQPQRQGALRLCHCP